MKQQGAVVDGTGRWDQVSETLNAGSEVMGGDGLHRFLSERDP